MRNCGYDFGAGMQPIFRLRRTIDISMVALRRSLTLLVLFAAGCTKTVYVPVEKTTTVVKTERDTIVEVRLEKEVVHTKTRDTVVTAETKYAEAVARWAGGEDERLSLDLWNKDVKVPVETKVVEVVIRDSVPYPVEVPVKVRERYVPWYYKIAWWAALACVALSLFGVTLLDIRGLFER